VSHICRAKQGANGATVDHPVMISAADILFDPRFSI
jgi:hypothetical protein